MADYDPFHETLVPSSTPREYKYIYGEYPPPSAPVSDNSAYLNRKAIAPNVGHAVTDAAALAEYANIK